MNQQIVRMLNGATRKGIEELNQQFSQSRKQTNDRKAEIAEERFAVRALLQTTKVTRIKKDGNAEPRKKGVILKEGFYSKEDIAAILSQLSES